MYRLISITEFHRFDFHPYHAHIPSIQMTTTYSLEIFFGFEGVINRVCDI